MRKILLIIITIFAIPLSFSAQAVTLDFEALEHVDVLIDIEANPLIEDGFQIDGTTLSTFGTLESRFTGSTALFENSVGSNITLSRVGGGTFDLISIDLAELNGNDVASVTFTRDGGFSQTFTLDGVAFGAETFVFDPAFIGSTTVSWVQVAPFHQFDNIVVDETATTTEAIPTLSEWAIITLIGLLGIFGITGVRRKV